MNQHSFLSATCLALASLIGLPTFVNGAAPIMGTTNPLDLKGQSTVVTFSEIPSATTPFKIDGAAFSGQGVILSSQFLNAPSGSPVLSSQSTPSDVIQIDFDSAVKSVGSYLNAAGQTMTAALHLELYNGDQLLANLDLSDFTSQTTTFFGAYANSRVITRAIFRNAIENRVSFLMDDVTFTVPEPSSASLLTALTTGIALLHRNRAKRQQRPLQ